MSDQPKPASGEWTVRHDNMIYADGVFVTLIPDRENRERVVAMHNAALAAAVSDARMERESTIEELEQQLAAEREATQIQGKELRDLRSSLAAEREKVEVLNEMVARLAGK